MVYSNSISIENKTFLTIYSQNFYNSIFWLYYLLDYKWLTGAFVDRRPSQWQGNCEILCKDIKKIYLYFTFTLISLEPWVEANSEKS